MEAFQESPSEEEPVEEEESPQSDEPPTKLCKTYRVLVTNEGIPEEALELLRAHCEVHFLPVAKDTKMLVRYTQGMDGLLIDDLEVPIDREFLREAGLGLKVISIVGIDGDQIDMKEAKSRKIKVGVCSSDLAVESSAEVAVGLALALSRRVKEGHNALLRGTSNMFSPEWLLGQDLKNCICGILGLGKLGTSIALRLQGFRPVKIIYYSRRVKKAGSKLGIDRVLFDELLELCDVIFLCLPYNLKTKEMFNEELFIKMKKSCVIINTSHGGLIKMNDLYCALRKRVIFGAGMDTELKHAPSRKHPIHRLDNFILLPSVSRSSALVKIRMYMKAVQNLISGLVDHVMLLQWDPSTEVDEVETEEERLVRVHLEEEQMRLENESIKNEWEDKSSKDGEEEEFEFPNQEVSIYTDWA